VDRKGGFRTPLHLVTDWPGYSPNGPQIVYLLIQAWADPNFRHPTRCDETPLHWAASMPALTSAGLPLIRSSMRRHPDPFM